MIFRGWPWGKNLNFIPFFQKVSNYTNSKEECRGCLKVSFLTEIICFTWMETECLKDRYTEVTMWPTFRPWFPLQRYS